MTDYLPQRTLAHTSHPLTAIIIESSMSDVRSQRPEPIGASRNRLHTRVRLAYLQLMRSPISRVRDPIDMNTPYQDLTRVPFVLLPNPENSTAVRKLSTTSLQFHITTPEILRWYLAYNTCILSKIRLTQIPFIQKNSLLIYMTLASRN